MYTMYISAHSRDLNVVSVENDKNEIIFEEEGYVPNFVTGIGSPGGDDWDFIIDMSTGQILNWDKKILENLHEKLSELENKEYE